MLNYLGRILEDDTPRQPRIPTLEKRALLTDTSSDINEQRSLMIDVFAELLFKRILIQPYPVSFVLYSHEMVEVCQM